MQFKPAALNVRRGDRITWMNKDLFPHSATGPKGTFDSASIPAGGSWTFVAGESGTFAYTCQLSPHDEGHAHCSMNQRQNPLMGSIQSLKPGDRAAFEQLMRQYNRRLYRLARATLRDDAEAEDALQDAYIAAYRSIDKFRGESTLSTWLSRLVLNECLGRLRRGARRQKVIPMVSPTQEMDAVPEQDASGPDRLLARAQIRAILERKLDDLPEAFRLVFVLRSVEELSVEETAQTLDIPEATVRSRYFRAKSLLREALAKEIDLAERDIFEFGGKHCDRIVTSAVSARRRDRGSGLSYLQRSTTQIEASVRPASGTCSLRSFIILRRSAEVSGCAMADCTPTRTSPSA